MKKGLYLLLAIILLTGCSSAENTSKDVTVSNKSNNEKMVLVSDSSGHKLSINTSPQKVIAVSSSMAEIWMLAGGNLVGVSEDALSEREFGLTEKDVEIIGTIKEPNTEKILAMQPDLVLLSQDIASHVELARILEEANIPYYMCKVEKLNDYLSILRNFVMITTKEELYIKNGVNVQKQVEQLLELLPKQDDAKASSALVLRAFSSGVKAQASDTVICDILKEIGVENIATDDNSILEDLSMESIMEENPDFIFVVTMGDEKEALDALETSFSNNPAWNKLDAIKNGKMIILPKELFHYKPNNRWGEAYEYLLNIIYPEIYREK